MTQKLVYKKEHLYEDVRGCIREGLSIKETADLCGCSTTTVRRFSEDIRDIKRRSKRATEFQVAEIMRLYFDMNMTYVQVAEKMHMPEYRIKSILLRKKEEYGYKKGHRENESMRGGIISNTIDINMLNAENEIKKINQQPIEQLVEPIAEVNEEPKIEWEEPKAEPIFEPLKEEKFGSIFSNLTACFDGKSARYTIRSNGKIRIMLNGVDFELPISEMSDMALEFTEIAKRFGGFA